MKVSENTLKWAMRFYPPLLFQRIWVRRFYAGFSGVEVTVKRSWLNRNYNASIFGGTLYSAADPFYPILFDQIFRRRGINTLVWLKAGQIKFIKPARSAIYLRIFLSPDEIQQAAQSLRDSGKHIAWYRAELYNDKQELCALIENQVYLRDVSFPARAK